LETFSDGTPFGYTHGTESARNIFESRKILLFYVGACNSGCVRKFVFFYSKKRVPDAREFKFVFRTVCLSQFEGKIHHGNYDIADADHLVRYCDSINTLKPSAQFNDEEETVPYGLMAHFVNCKLSVNVKEALYNYIGAL
jgi:hypothetical protein